jgi:dTDP-4-dehydrorhamnose reductase
MRVLILGGTGMLGHKLVQTMGEIFETWTIIHGPFVDVAHTGIFDEQRTIENTDVRDYASLEEKIRSIRPDVLVNAVGIIKQDPAYRDVEKLITINSILPHKLAEITGRLGCRLILVSTDCVFSGKRGNYKESDPADAEDTYGKSKHLGEISWGNCLTLRTSIIGRELASSNSLAEWFFAQANHPIRGFTRAIYSGFPTIVFSKIISEIITNQRDLSGVWHLSSNPISKYDLLKTINQEFGAGHEIIPDNNVKIDRSLDSGRFRESVGFRPMSWREMIREMASDPTPYEVIRSHNQDFARNFSVPN